MPPKLLKNIFSASYNVLYQYVFPKHIDNVSGALCYWGGKIAVFCYAKKQNKTIFCVSTWQQTSFFCVWVRNVSTFNEMQKIVL